MVINYTQSVQEKLHFEKEYKPHLVFYEVTKSCNLKCIHCRAVPSCQRDAEELSKEEVCTLIDQLAVQGNPIFVLSGGEPLLREDIFDIAEYGSRKLMVALATNGTLINEDIAEKIKNSGIKRVSISLDGPNKEIHDSFRKVEGAFDKAVQAIHYLKQQEISVQINTTVVNHNVKFLPDLVHQALELEIDALHFFLLVPVGCGIQITEKEMLSAEKYEEILNWIFDMSHKYAGKLFIKATCAPQYYRILHQKKQHSLETYKMHLMQRHHQEDKVDFKSRAMAMTKGCLAGTGICFIDHKGKIYPCGYLPTEAGDLRQDPFPVIWETSKIFQDLRNPNLLEGKCGVCHFKKVCEGCRARAFFQYGSYLAEEPYCVYTPN